jgi:hypothetical protein
MRLTRFLALAMMATSLISGARGDDLCPEGLAQRLSQNLGMLSSKHREFLTEFINPVIGKRLFANGRQPHPCLKANSCIEIMDGKGKAIRVNFIRKSGSEPWVEVTQDVHVLMIPSDVDFHLLPDRGRSYIQRLFLGTDLHPQVDDVVIRAERKALGEPEISIKSSQQSVMTEIAAADAAGVRKSAVVFPPGWGKDQILLWYLQKRFSRGKLHVVVSDSDSEILKLRHAIEQKAGSAAVQIIDLGDPGKALSLRDLAARAEKSDRPTIVTASVPTLAAAVKSAGVSGELQRFKQVLGTLVYDKDSFQLRPEAKSVVTELITDQPGESSRLLGLVEAPTQDSFETTNLFQRTFWVGLKKGGRFDDSKPNVDQLIQCIRLAECTPLNESAIIRMTDLQLIRDDLNFLRPDANLKLRYQARAYDILFKDFLIPEIVSRAKGLIAAESIDEAKWLTTYLNESKANKKFALFHSAMTQEEKTAIAQRYRDRKIDYIVTPDQVDWPGIEFYIDLKSNSDIRPAVSRLHRVLAVEAGRSKVDAVILVETNAKASRSSMPLIDANDAGLLSRPKRPEGMPGPGPHVIASRTEKHENPQFQESLIKNNNELELQAESDRIGGGSAAKEREPAQISDAVSRNGTRIKTVLERAIRRITAYFTEHHEVPPREHAIGRLLSKYASNPEFVRAMDSNPETKKLFFYYLQSAAGRTALDVIEFAEINIRRMRGSIDSKLFNRRRTYSVHPDYIAIMEKYGRHVPYEHSLVRFEKNVSETLSVVENRADRISKSVTQRFVDKKFRNHAIDEITSFFLEKDRLPPKGHPAFEALENYGRDPEVVRAMYSQPKTALLYHYYLQSPAGRTALDVLEFAESDARVIRQRSEVGLYERLIQYRDDPDYKAIMRELDLELTYDRMVSKEPRRISELVIEKKMREDAIERINSYFHEKGHLPPIGSDLYKDIEKYKNHPAFVRAMNSHLKSAELFYYFLQSEAGRAALEVIKDVESGGRRLKQSALALYQKRKKHKDDPEYRAIMEKYGRHLTYEQSLVQLGPAPAETIDLLQSRLSAQQRNSTQNAKRAAEVENTIETVIGLLLKSSQSKQESRYIREVFNKYKDNPAFVRAMDSNSITSKLFYYYLRSPAGRTALDVIDFSAEQTRLIRKRKDSGLYQRRLRHKGHPDYKTVIERYGRHLPYEQSQVRIESVADTPSKVAEARLVEFSKTNAQLHPEKKVLEESIQEVSKYFVDNDDVPPIGHPVYEMIEKYKDDPAFIRAMGSQPKTAMLFYYYLQTPAGRTALDVIRFAEKHNDPINRHTDNGLYLRRLKYKQDPNYISVMEKFGNHLPYEYSLLQSKLEVKGTVQAPKQVTAAEVPTPTPKLTRQEKYLEDAVQRTKVYFSQNGRIPPDGDPVYKTLQKYKTNQAYVDAMNADPESRKLFYYFTQSAAGRAAFDVIGFADKNSRLIDRRLDDALYQRRNKYKSHPDYIAIMEKNGGHLPYEQSLVRLANGTSENAVSILFKPTNQLTRQQRSLKEAILEVLAKFLGDERLPPHHDPALKMLQMHKDKSEFVSAMNAHPVSRKLFYYYIQSDAGRVALDVIDFAEKSAEPINRKSNYALYQRRLRYKDHDDYIAVMKESGTHLPYHQSLVRMDAETIGVKKVNATSVANQSELDKDLASKMEDLVAEYKVGRKRQAAIDTAEKTILYVKAGNDLDHLKEKNPVLFDRFILHSSHPAFRARILESPKTTEEFEAWIKPPTLQKPWSPIRTDLESAEETARFIIRYSSEGGQLDDLRSKDRHLSDAFIRFANDPKFRSVVKTSPRTQRQVEEWLTPPMRDLSPVPSAQMIDDSVNSAQRLISFVKSGKGFSNLNWHDTPELYSELIQYTSYPSFRTKLQEHPETYRQFLEWLKPPKAQ